MCGGHPGAGGPATSDAAERVANTAPPTASATITANKAMRKRRCRALRLASAISGSRENGSRGTCTVIALLSLAPPSPSRAIPQGSFRNTAPRRAHRPPDSASRDSPPFGSDGEVGRWPLGAIVAACIARVLQETHVVLEAWS